MVQTDKTLYPPGSHDSTCLQTIHYILPHRWKLCVFQPHRMQDNSPFVPMQRHPMHHKEIDMYIKTGSYYLPSRTPHFYIVSASQAQPSPDNSHDTLLIPRCLNITRYFTKRSKFSGHVVYSRFRDLVCCRCLGCIIPRLCCGLPQKVCGNYCKRPINFALLLFPLSFLLVLL